ncbi:hypothetical protein EYC84_006262 [Monilinia fructicola]|uniref:Uncharacterized protein n=1 Tax=Monilinia fructicola TaxID=38448 RepID=A0A5M9K5A1_MONFR|nr:hypothetical protein EYC84_006262 [Monilinia fructicola]
MPQKDKKSKYPPGHELPDTDTSQDDEITRPPPPSPPSPSPLTPPRQPSSTNRKLKVPKFLTNETPVELPPNPATTFKGHEQPPVNERLEQIKTFLADEDANRCLDFKDKLKEIQEYLDHVEKHNIPRDWKLFKDAKVMTETQADWHDRMDKTSLGGPLCVDSPQIQPYSTRLMSNEVTLAIRETKELNGTQTQVRENRPPFTVQRTKDHPIFLRAIKLDARKTLTDLTEEEQNRNLFKIESRAYNEAKDVPALIPLWTDSIRGLPITGKSQSSEDPWYGNGQLLGVTPKAQVKQKPTHNVLPSIVSSYQNILRGFLGLYRESVIRFGRGDQRHMKDWRVAVLKAFLRLFPTPEAKALERNANVYSTGQRKENITDEEYRAVKDDWKKYNDLQDQLLEHLSAKTTPPVQFYFDEPDMVKTDLYDPSKINIPREYGDRLREVYEMQTEVIYLLRECRDQGGPQKCDWFILGRIAEILAPVEPDMFGEVGRHWAQFKTRHIPSLWDKAYGSLDKHKWLNSRDAEERAIVDTYIKNLQELWTEIFDRNPDLRRDESTLVNDEPWIVLLPLQRGALRTDSLRHKMTADFIQPYIFYVPWATPKPKLSPEMEEQLKRIHKLLKEKDESGGRLPHNKMAALRQNLAPFFYPRLRRMYDQTLSDNELVRNPALRAFSMIFEPWLAGFEGVGIEIRNYQPEESQALLNRTIPANLTDVPADTKAPQLRQRDPSVLYQTHQRLDPDSLNALNAELNRDLPDDGDVGAHPAAEGWSEKLKKKYASIIGPPKLKGLRSEIAKVEQEIGDQSLEDPIVKGFLNKELSILHRKFEAAGRQFVMGVRGVARSQHKRNTVTVLQSADFVGTDVDTDNIPGVFYLATKPPSPMTIHPERVDTLSLVPDLDTGINRNLEQNWKQFILGYPKQTSRYDTGTLNFQSKAERRGIQRAAIEMALNLLASNYEQRRPDDRFRRVVLPSPWQPPPPEVPISMELEPTKRPLELDTTYYTDLIYQYNQWKDDDWYDAREKIVKMFPGQVPPPANYNGPFTIPTMFEYQDVAAKQILDEFERDMDALPEAAKPPYWSSGQPPDIPQRHQYSNIPESQRDLRSVSEYHHETSFEPTKDEDIEKGDDQEGLTDHVARVALTGHPETKYVEKRESAYLMYGIQYRSEGGENVFTVQYNADRLTGPPIIQPNLYSFIEKASFKFGRAIAAYTEELTLDETHYTRELCLDIVNLSYQRVVLRSEGKPIYPGEPNVPPATPNPNNITLVRIASDLEKVAPDIFETYNLNPNTLSDPAVPLKTRTRYAALMIQSQVIEELNNNWESRFPVNEKVWGFARDRLVNPVRTVVAGRTFTEYHRPRQYFSMRRWPPCEQSLASQEVIRDSGPVIQAKVVKKAVPRKAIGEKKLDSLRKTAGAATYSGRAAQFPIWRDRVPASLSELEGAGGLEGCP